MFRPWYNQEILMPFKCTSTQNQSLIIYSSLLVEATEIYFFTFLIHPTHFLSSTALRAADKEGTFWSDGEEMGVPEQGIGSTSRMRTLYS